MSSLLKRVSCSHDPTSLWAGSSSHSTHTNHPAVTLPTPCRICGKYGLQARQPADASKKKAIFDKMPATSARKTRSRTDLPQMRQDYFQPSHLMDSAFVNHEVIIFLAIVKDLFNNEQNPHENGQRPGFMDKDSQDDHSKEETSRHP